MRALDLYTEKNLRDGSPDKIAASKAFGHEVNGISFSSGGDITGFSGSSGNSKSNGLMSVFTDFGVSKKSMQQRDKLTLASVAMCNPLMLIGLGAGMAIADEFKLARERALLNRNPNENEEIYRAGTLRELKLQKEKEAKEKPDFKPSLDALTISFQMSDAAITGKVVGKPKFKKDKVSITRGVTMIERGERADRSSERALNSSADGPLSMQAKDVTAVKKLLKQQQALKDFLEKFRGKLDLQTVSSLMGQMERLDKSLARFGY
ncbi:unnamed protein product [Sphagnum balticum]